MALFFRKNYRFLYGDPNFKERMSKNEGKT